MKKFLIRFSSAFFAVALIFIIYFYFQQQGLQIFIALLIPIALYEYTQFLQPYFARTFIEKFLFILSGSLVPIAFFINQVYLIPSILFSIFVLLTYLLFKIKEQKEYKNALNTQAMTSLGIIYCSLLPILLIKILTLPSGLYLFSLLLVIVFCGDTFAYIFGMLFGKKKVAPLVSPNKTWIGSFGGLLGSSVFALLLSYWFSLDISPVRIIIISVLTGLIAQIGDFFESLLKRTHQIKDSGQIMPGHGGILDRVDGLLFAAPFFYYIIS